MEEGSIALYLSARKAYEKVDLVNREMIRLFGRKAGANAKRKKMTEEIKAVIADAVASSIEATYTELIPKTPKQTKFLVSNWRISQGRRPALASLIEPPPNKLSSSFSLPPNVTADGINGRKVQWIYNQSSYAKEVAAGFNASGRPIRSGGGPMWFMNIGQKFSSGVYFKTALSEAIARRR